MDTRGPVCDTSGSSRSSSRAVMVRARTAGVVGGRDEGKGCWTAPDTGGRTDLDDGGRGRSTCGRAPGGHSRVLSTPASAAPVSEPLNGPGPVTRARIPPATVPHLGRGGSVARARAPSATASHLGPWGFRGPRGPRRGSEVDGDAEDNSGSCLSSSNLFNFHVAGHSPCRVPSPTVRTRRVEHRCHRGSPCALNPTLRTVQPSRPPVFVLTHTSFDKGVVGPTTDCVLRRDVARESFGRPLSTRTPRGRTGAIPCRTQGER